MNKPELIIDGVSSLKAILEKNEIEYDIEPKISIFIHILKKVKDFRVKGRTIYKLENILALCFILIMKDEFKSFNYASKYIEYHKDYFEKLGLIENGNIPSHDALRRIFMCLDANTLRDRFINRIKEFYYKILSNYNSKAKISLYNADGKEFRSSGRNFQNKILCNANVFNIYNSSEAICLSSTPLMDKESEIPEFQRMISKFNLKNVVVTADALRCQKDSAKAVISRKGNYVFTVKKNQKSLYQDIKEKTASNNTINLKYNDCDYEIFTLKKNYIGLEFEGQKSYIKMTSYKRKKQDVKNVQTLFFLSSLKEPKLIVEAIDNRWNIENDLHKTKDELFNEDYYTFTDKNAIKVMAVLNNICYSLYKIMTAFLHNKDLTYTKIEFKDNPERVLGKIIPLLEKDNFEELIRSNLKGRKK